MSDDKDEGVPASANSEVLDAFESKFAEVMADEARRQAEEASVETILSDSPDSPATVDVVDPAHKNAEKEKADDEGDGTDGASASLDLSHRALLRDVYESRDGELVWYVEKDGSLRPADATESLRKKLVAGVRAHGLWPEQLHLTAIRELGRDETGVEEQWDGFSLRSNEREKLLQYLADQGLDLGAGEIDRVAEAAVRNGGPTPRIAEKVQKRARDLEGDVRRMARRELLLTDALAEYLQEMRYRNPAWHRSRSWRVTARLGDHGPLRSKSLSGKEYDETPATHMRRAVEEARTRSMTAAKLLEVFEEPSTVGTVMKDVQPPFQQYQRLTKAFERYRKYVENGGWPELPKRAMGLREGYRAPYVRTLKRRLWIEGYWEPPEDVPESARRPEEENGEGKSALSERFGASLEEAVEAYQKTHQFYVEGVVEEPTWESLNVPARRRWHQIRVTLDRWRDSRVGGDDHYVHINVPDFHAEVWKGGDRKMRFRVVTGSSDIQRDEETGEKNYYRATPRFSDTIEYIVVNPFWNIPESIRRNEIKPKLASDPSFLEKNEYEVVEGDHGQRILRQKPGDQNALGHMKFMFPNEHSVYMHDTPERHLFRNPTRAYSHGCIRIEDPMEFAKYLLKQDGRGKNEWHRKSIIENRLEKDEEKWLTLENEIPVHIEYFVVRVDDDGRANFLADLYDLDASRLERVAKRVDGYEEDYDLPEPEFATSDSAEDEPTDPAESEDEPTDPSESEDEPTDPSESEDEPTDPAESEDEPTDPAESEDEPTDPAESDEDE